LLLPGYPSFAESTGLVLTCIGMATMAFGIVSLLAAQTLTRVAGSYLMVSSGTLLTAIGFGGPAVTAALLLYLLTSTLAASALYLTIEPVERNVANGSSLGGAEPVFEDEFVGGPEDEEQETETGVAIPATVAFLGGGFILVALLLAGRPPMPVFIGKFALISALAHRGGDSLAWMTIGLLIISGLAALIAMSRAGIDLLWKPSDRPPARINIIEATPIGLLLAICVALVVWAGPVMSYLQRTAQELHHPMNYVESVLGSKGTGR
jgi:multicomponent K+:H+ antiporter subunit D